MFFLWEAVKKEAPSTPRPPGAFWIMATPESPFRERNRNEFAVHALNGSINVLMSYDQSAHIWVPFGQPVKLPSRLSAVPAWLTWNRTRTAVIVESYCLSKDRNAKMAQIKSAVTGGVDVMGHCGTVKHAECDARDPNCFKILAKTYYFYIAIENSECPDYITEKVWLNSLDAGMVPIVWSDKVDYRRLLPPHSYINVADFASVREFAAHLQDVMDVPHLYARYHEWRTEYRINGGGLSGEKICAYLQANRGSAPDAINIPAIRHCWGSEEAT